MYNIGVDIGGTKIAIGLVDRKGKIVEREFLFNNSDMKSEEVINNLAESIKKIISKTNIRNQDINSIGVGFPSKVTEEGVVDAPNINFHNVNIVSELKKFIPDIPIYVENDANCATIAEYVYGSLKGMDDSILITLGTGVGGGIIINGKLYRGYSSTAGELGHQVIILDGKKCGCGRQGCLEAYASTKALVERIKGNILSNNDSIIYKLVDGEIDKITAKIFFEAIEKEDQYAKKMYKEHVKYIATGIINLIQIFDPEGFAIGGGISAQKDKLLMPILDEINNQISDALYKIGNTKICIAELGNDAGIIGAAEIYRMR